jgi:hypothetical protein
VEWVFSQESVTGPLEDFKSFCLQQGYVPAAAPSPAKRPSLGGGGGVFSIGKHRGKTFDEVRLSDESYVSWVLGLADCSGNMLEFQTYLKSQSAASLPPPKVASPYKGASAGPTVPSGKHAGKSFAQVVEADPGYCSWLQTLEDIKAQWMKDFKAYLIANNIK